MSNLVKKINDLKFKNKNNLNIIFNDLIEYIDNLEKDKDNAIKKLIEYDEDKRIVELKNEINRLYDCSVSILTQKEKDEYLNFRLKHSGCGIGVDFIISNNMIGNVTKLKCNGCGDIQDITDYDAW